MPSSQDPKQGVIMGQLSKLRHPWLLALALSAFGADLLIPDVLPFVDEIVLGAVAATLAALRKRRAEPDADETEPEGEPERDA